MNKDLLKQTSDKKQKLIDAKNASPFVKGEKVVIPYPLISSYSFDSDKNKTVSVEVIKVNKKTLLVEHNEYSRPTKHKIKYSDVISRDLLRIGENPFDENFDTIRPVPYVLESIIFSLNILGDKNDYKNDKGYFINGVELKECNWNPYVYNKDGEKEYYQRDFCWSLKDKQLLIDSIYNGIDCGKILIRKNSWAKLERLIKEGEKDVAFRDIVDGKQRLDAVRGFILNEYPDSEGNYYEDLSFLSQHKFTEHQLFGYSEMSEITTDEEVIYQFLKMNFTGVPQSEEHLDFVKEISNKFN